MTIFTPGGPVVLYANSRDLSALRYLRFNQAWARENGLGTDLYDADSHLARLGLFLGKQEISAALGQYNNLLLGLQNLAGADADYPARPEAQHLQAAALAPLVQSIGGVACPDVSEAGLRATHEALLATGISQAQVEEAYEQSKKNFQPT